MNVSVFGAGYVGLVQAAVLADVGHEVLCIDIDKAKVLELERGIVSIFEPGLEEIISRNLKNQRLRFTTSRVKGAKFGDIQFIAVGTPPEEDGSADLRHVMNVARNIAKYIEKPVIVVNKSTVPVGTALKVKNQIDRILLERGITFDVHVVANPEFLKEGSAIEDSLNPDRVILGTDEKGAIEALKRLYKPFKWLDDRIFVMDSKSAEFTKYAANGMLATKISFMNELSVLAEELGANIEEVRKGIGADKRIGPHFIAPGCGYGGSCFPKDVQALIQQARKARVEMNLLSAVETVNNNQKNLIFKKVLSHFDGNIKDKVIALWGLSFKPNTNDMREASSRVFMESVWEAGGLIQAHDPVAMKECQRLYGAATGLRLVDQKEGALIGADALVIVTEWQDYQNPDFKFIKTAMKKPVIFDGRNLFEPGAQAMSGIKYYSIGRSAVQ